VIERAAVLAEGADSAAVLRWISDHGGEPEEVASKKVADRGLHATRLHDHDGAGSQAPSRYVLPPEALAKPGGE
jgi:hypothetical protein